MNRTLILLCLGLILFSCQTNQFDVELEAKELDLSFIRLDQEVFRSEIDDPIDRHENLLETYPNFYPDYFERILRIGPVDDSISALNFNRISQEVIFEESQKEIDSVFFFDQDLREDFLKAFRYFAYYFPNEQLPKVIGMNSGFNYAVYPSEKNLAFGLEFYLGKEHYITRDLPVEQFPNYQKAKMDKSYLVSDALRGYLLSKNQDLIQGDKLLNHIIYQGKMMYALNAILPFEKEHLQLGYLEKEMDWCNKNEFNIWKAIIDEDLLFTSNFKEVQRFTGYGPFTQGFPEESPGMISLFIGKRIVLDFMDKNQEYSISELFEERDEVVLKTFKPKK